MVKSELASSLQAYSMRISADRLLQFRLSVGIVVSRRRQELRFPAMIRAVENLEKDDESGGMGR